MTSTFGNAIVLICSNHGLQKMKWFRRLERGQNDSEETSSARHRHLEIHQVPSISIRFQGFQGAKVYPRTDPVAIGLIVSPDHQRCLLGRSHKQLEQRTVQNYLEISKWYQMSNDIKRYPRDIPSLLVFEIFEDIWGSFDLIWSDLVMPSQDVQDLADLVSEVSDWDVHLLVGFCGHLRAGGRSLQTRSLRGGWGDPPR